MDSVNKTLYIPLYAKAYVSRKGILLQDKKAEEIWEKEGFPLKRKAKSKWLAYNMGMRSAVFDRWTEKQLKENPDAVVLHVGCGLYSRCIRVETMDKQWYDVDFPEVIAERKRYFAETDSYQMIGSDIREAGWLAGIPAGKPAIIVMEGVSMYLKPEELKGISDLEKVVGKKKFNELCGEYIVKPQGKPTLVPESDKRPAFNAAADDFKDI